MGRRAPFKRPRPPIWRRALTLVSSAALVLGLTTLPAAQATADAGATAGASVKVLVFHGPADKQDDPVDRAAAAIGQLGGEHGFSVDVSADPGVFTTGNLARYRGVVFLSANGVTLNEDQEAAFRAYIRDGGGFVGVHDAARAQADSSWFTDLIGTRPAGSLPNPEKVTDIAVNGENPPNETKDKLIDGKNETKWLTFTPTGWIQMTLERPVAVAHYALTSANDFPGRDPKDWTLQGSQDGVNWTVLDSRTGQSFPQRFQTREFTFTNSTAYQHYRLDITANNGEPLTQLAELRLFGPSAGPPPESRVQSATVDVTDRQHPANAGLPLNLTRSDQWMNWAPNPTGKVHAIAQVEERTYDPGLNGNGAFHPISWCRDFDGGRSFYTGMGRTDASYTSDRQFQSHLLGGIEWATGMIRGDCQATIASNYSIERLTLRNKSGQLDQIGEPHGLTIAPDGKVFYIGKAACPTGPIPDWNDPKVGLGCGTIHQWDPKTKQAKLLTTLDVMGNRGDGGGDELVKNEEGLVGITLDPDFEHNGWIYVLWMPHESIDRDNQIGQRTISRFTYDFGKESIDQGTRKDLLHWDAQIHSCCHAGGGMTFDKQGNLYVGSGDNNSSLGAEAGYSGNNWTKDFKGVSFQDARRTAGNTDNLNGKIIRIHPEPDGTYTIPQGNLFAPGTPKTRPEIYVMGVRNIARIAWDNVNNWLTAGWVGPDANDPSETWGPAKYDTATILTSAGNQGWPYCMGNRQPYRDRSNVDASQPAGWYDCDHLKNESPRNTGLVDIPPARSNMIYYSPHGGGVTYPKRTDGSGLPTYKLSDETYTEPYLRGGCQAIMDGPTYHRSLVNTGSGVAWPAYWDNKWFIGDECNPDNRIAATVDPKDVPNGQPAFAEDLRSIIQPGGGGNQLQSWMDAKFGPDGALYMLDYAGGFFSLDPNQKLIRITYHGGPPTPNPSDAAVRAVRQSEPNTIAFSSTKAGGVSWRWDFGDGSPQSTEANPTHTYASFGVHHATLTVRYADGEVATGKIDVNVGCSAPDARPTVWLLDTNTGVANHAVGGGCTLNDLIDDERTWSNHGEFVSNLDALVDRFQAAGIVTEQEATKLRDAGAQSPIGKTNGYESIFDGTPQSLQGWSQAPSGRFDLLRDGSIRSAGGLGMLWYRQKDYGDFSVRLQFRDVAPAGSRANSGVFVRFPDPRTPLDKRPPGSCGTVGAARTDPAWVAIFCGQEVQIYDGDTGEPQKTGSVYNFAPLGLDKAGVTAKGAWNDYEVRVVGQHYTIIRNGVVINEFDNTPGKQSSRDGDPPTDLRQFASGFIGLQNHSDNDLIEFRNIRVRTL